MPDVETSSAKRAILYRRGSQRNAYCYICGRRVFDGSGTLEHLIPQAVFKWQECYPEALSEEDMQLRDTIANTAIAHYDCNSRKGSMIYEPRQFKKLAVTIAQAQDYQNLFNKLSNAISAYQELKQDVMWEQNCGCYICGMNVTERSGVLRRIDVQCERSRDNACVVCHKCCAKVTRKKGVKQLKEEFCQCKEVCS